MPDWTGPIRERLARLHLSGAREAEIIEELSGHLDQQYAMLRRAGYSAEDARKAGLVELEGHELIIREMRKPAPEAIGATRGGNLMSEFLHDLKIAVRTLRTRPGFAAMVVGMLALGIGGNTAIFGIFNGLVLRPLPFAHADRLIDVDETAPKWQLKYVSVSANDFYLWQQANSTFEDLGAYATGGGNLSTDNGAVQRVKTASVTYNFLNVFGLKPALGRGISSVEDRKDGAKVMLLSNALWHRLYNADPGVIGRVVKLSEQPYTIVGVLPEEAVWPLDMDAWIPLAVDHTAPSNYYLGTVGRLRHGVSAQQAEADLYRIHRAAAGTPGHTSNGDTAPVLTALRAKALGDLSLVTRILLGAVALVLLIACVNIASIMLVRGEARSREIAIRMAVGASRSAIIRQLLTESLMLALLGGAAGMLLGKLFLRGLISMIPDDAPRWLRFEMDWRFALFGFAVTAAAAILFGLVPALQAAGGDARDCIQEMSRSTMSRRKGRALNAMVICEFALALTLLVGAGLMVQAFQKALRTNPGFRPENLTSWNMRLAPTKYPKAEQQFHFYSNLLDRVRALPGVQSAGAASLIPLGGHTGTFFEAEGEKQDPNQANPVTLQVTAMPGYFETMGIEFLAGRQLDAHDEVASAPRVAVVNETFARHYFPGRNAVGHRIAYAFATKKDWYEVVGVTRDTRHYGLDQEMKPSVFLPFSQAPSNGMFIVLRTAGDVSGLMAPIREVIRQLDASLPAYDVRTMTARLEKSLWTRRIYSWLFAAFAATAILLAALGIYGVTSFAVSQRFREIGIRMALGARPGQVTAKVLGSGMALVAAGVVLGLAASAVASRVLQTLLFQVSTKDVATYAAAVGGVAAIGLLANYIPARRAARIDPMRTLRSE
jgi:predicted permease